MSRRFNEPHLMGNCENCYYATDVVVKRPWLPEGQSYECHRFPQIVEKERGDYCGEFAWKQKERTDKCEKETAQVYTTENPEEAYCTWKRKP